MEEMLRALAAAVRRLCDGLGPRWCPRYLEDMPGHPEVVRFLDDPDEDITFGDIAEQLLDDGFADLAERLGWMR